MIIDKFTRRGSWKYSDFVFFGEVFGTLSLLCSDSCGDDSLSFNVCIVKSYGAVSYDGEFSATAQSDL